MNSFNKVFLNKITNIKPVLEFTSTSKKILFSTNLRNDKKLVKINIEFSSSLDDIDTLNMIKNKYPQIDLSNKEIYNSIINLKRMTDVREEDKNNFVIEKDFVSDILNIFTIKSFTTVKASKDEQYH